MKNLNRDILIERSEDSIKLIQSKDNCDKYDYLIAAGCGALGGIIDIFLVGAPGDSVLGKWTDKQVDSVVMSFAKKMGWKPRSGNENNVKSAIGHLERNRKVNYDQRTTKDVGGKFSMAPGSHHMMSLGHSPDIIGLFFSILNQFTSTSSFIANGQLITIDTENFELQGGNFISKIFCGAFNWFYHLMSDVAGGSGAHGRGSGISAPFYELFGLCTFGRFKTQSGYMNLAELAEKAFNMGFDARFALTQAIPVVITDLLIRLCWALRRRFQMKKPLKECIPTSSHESLRLMLLVGNGTLCVIDGIDAAIRSGGDALTFFLRLNLVAWFRLITLVIKEILIRLGFSADLEHYIESLKVVNQALTEYMAKLEQIDAEQFARETENYNKLASSIEGISDEKSLNSALLIYFNTYNLPLPWDGDFDDFMQDKNNKLVFK